MKKYIAALLSGLLIAAFTVNTVSAQEETTKQKWVKKKKAEADRQAEKIADDHKGTVGSAKEQQQKAAEYKKNKHKEIDETAAQLGDGKKKK